MTLGQAALKWVLAEPTVTSAQPNIYDLEQLEEFAAAPGPAGPDAGRPRARSRRSTPATSTSSQRPSDLEREEASGGAGDDDRDVVVAAALIGDLDQASGPPRPGPAT